MRLLLRLALLATMISPAMAQTIDVPGVSPYHCRGIGGSPSGSSCRAPYQEYSGNACSVFESSGAPSNVREFVRRTTGSCSASAVQEAKKQTLQYRARLRGYASPGSEDQNDPVENMSYRPRGASSGAGEIYFAAECAVRTCGGGGGDSPSSRDDDDSSRRAPPPRQAPSRPTPPPLPSPTPANLFKFVACNQSSTGLYLATSSKNGITGQYQTRGWTFVQPGRCAEVGWFEKGRFYFYAGYRDGTSARQITGLETLNLCVQPEPQNFFRGSRDPCTSGQRRDFTSFFASEDTHTATWR